MSDDESIASKTASDDGGDFLRLIVGLTVMVIVAVIGAVALAPAPAQAPPAPNAVDIDTSEYAVEDVTVKELPAEGEIEPTVTGNGIVVFDDAHLNEFDRSEIEPLVRAFVRAGYEVRFHEGGDLEGALADADAYVVIDPDEAFDEEEREVVTSFTDEGGRLAVFGEPTRITVRSGFGGVTVARDVREGDALVGEYGLDFSSSYVYNQLENDGGFKNPIAEPTGPAASAGDQVPVYTAAEVVQVQDEGQVVLEFPAESRLAETDRPGEYAVAVRSGNLLAVGDATMLRSDRYNVADNEAFLGYVVDFLVSGDRRSVTDEGTED